jgi:bifunctional enzyme CysN/CysC
MSSSAPLLRVVTCGSVDDGKSTLIGRLLVETDSVPLDEVERARTYRRAGSIIPVGEVDYSLLTDGLEAEREQGITIDVAYRHLLLPSGRRVILADGPGHEQYTRNMAVAASDADVALLLVDATKGVRDQTMRHLTVCALMGVGTVIAVINKLDAKDFAKSVVDDLSEQLTSAANRLGVKGMMIIPVSALLGDNVINQSTNTTWYEGPTILGALQQWQPAQVSADAQLRLPIQTILRADDWRGYGGTVVSGKINLGDTFMVSQSGKQAKIAQLYVNGVPNTQAIAGQSVAFKPDVEIDISRGDVLCDPAQQLQPADRFSADVVWIGEEPLAHGRSYSLICGPTTVNATVTTIRHKLDVNTGHEDAARVLNLNEIGRVTIATEKPIPMDLYQEVRDTGGFLLVDRVTKHTVAAGMVHHVLRRSFNVVPHEFEIDKQARGRLKAQTPKVIWLTGLPGSGKSTLANEVERRLYAAGIHTYLLDGDNVRTGLNKDLGFTTADRAENVRRVGEVAKLMVDAGLIVLVSLVSPFRSDRDAVKEIFPYGEFIEVFVDTPVEVCAQRDPKGLYAKAQAGDLPNMTGMGQNYEVPLNPDLIIDGTADLAQSAEQVIAKIMA